ncbi:hypothetical protein [Bradyrhizobium sp. Tv2a-2]|uniref:hypothetical protein n=1 Tax=Bradyrhizobium sp. Tv2a-2 TaxID=113395 RepID=UPI000465F2C8|nr:hypothetical protein [Bradyrhizobium sp. Tv2a-2]
MTKSAPREQLTDKAVIALTEADLDLVVGGGEYLKYEMSNVFISSYSASGGAQSVPTEPLVMH